MTISDGLNLIKTQLILGRTPKAMPITGYALQCLDSVLQDSENYGATIVKCKNKACCFVISGLLVENGCPNCGYPRLDEYTVTEGAEQIVKKE